MPGKHQLSAVGAVLRQLPVPDGSVAVGVLQALAGNGRVHADVMLRFIIKRQRLEIRKNRRYLHVIFVKALPG